MPDLVRTSKFLSLVLRHDPGAIGLTLDAAGWADVETLIRLANAAGNRLDRTLLDQVVAENTKKRFSFSEDGARIRANQGHSVDVDLGFAPADPPEILFHGTATRFLESIRAKGLIPGSRLHVHLSVDEATAVAVGQRHGRPAVLRVRARELRATGTEFYLSANGVWLCPHVPPEHLDFPMG